MIKHYKVVNPEGCGYEHQTTYVRLNDETHEYTIVEVDDVTGNKVIGAGIAEYSIEEQQINGNHYPCYEMRIPDIMDPADPEPLMYSFLPEDSDTHQISQREFLVALGVL